ncbi:MAG TPA: NAD-dependent epimerase/dehydratase family protein [Actinocrinis sp.]|nr:NAD-dependent epimerase/dehydratase family protein [Actinocrinis sp.]
MRVIVLGGTWFVERAVCAVLREQGHEVTVVHRGLSEPEELAEARSAGVGVGGITHLHAERTRWPEHRADFAAFEPDAAVDVSAMNGAGARHALAALPAGLRLVALSSVDVYRAYESTRSGEQTDAVPLTESSPLRTGRYLDGPDWENLELEDVYRDAGAALLRLGAVYGEHDYQRRLEFALRRVRGGRRRMPIGSGAFLFSRVYVRDVGTAVLAALTTPGSAGETYNVVESATPGFGLLAAQIVAAAEAEMELVRVPDDALPPDLALTGGARGSGSGTQHLLASAARAREQLGWSETDPDVALRRSVDWHLRHPPEDWNRDFAEDDAALTRALAQS